jgi:hypothetical protein
MRCECECELACDARILGNSHRCECDANANSNPHRIRIRILIRTLHFFSSRKHGIPFFFEFQSIRMTFNLFYTKFQHFSDVSSSFPRYFSEQTWKNYECGIPYHRKVKNANAIWCANAMRMRIASNFLVRMRCECEFQFALPALIDTSIFFPNSAIISPFHFHVYVQ